MSDRSHPVLHLLNRSSLRTAMTLCVMALSAVGCGPEPPRFVAQNSPLRELL